MKLGLKLPMGQKSTAEFAVRAEEQGFESVWLGELWGGNVFVELAEVAERTSEIRLGTAIVNVYSRTPAVIAMGAYSLDNLSCGRAVVGLGVSTSKVVEDLHSMAFERPVRRTHETVQLVNAFLDGEGVIEYSQEVFDVSGFPALEADVPLYNAALGPANRRVTGRICEGWMPNNIPFSNYESAFETIADSAREAGRNPDDIEVAPWVHVAVNGEDPETARDLIRGIVAYYIGSGVGYKHAIGAVFPEEVERIATAWRSGNRDEARTNVTDEMVAELSCTGRPQDVREQIHRIVEETPVDLPILNIPSIADSDVIEQTLEAVAPNSF